MTGIVGQHGRNIQFIYSNVIADKTNYFRDSHVIKRIVKLAGGKVSKAKYKKIWN